MEKAKHTSNLSYALKNIFFRRYILITGFSAAAILIFGYFFFLSPMLGKLNVAKDFSVETKKEELEKLTVTLKGLEDAKKEYEGFTPELLSQIENIIPLEDDLPGIFLQMQNIAQKNNFILTSIEITPIADSRDATDSQATAAPGATAGAVAFEPGGGAGPQTESLPAAPIEPSVHKLNISFVISGGGYGEMKNFLRDIEKNIRLFDVYDISFSSPEEGPYTINLRTYYLSS